MTNEQFLHKLHILYPDPYLDELELLIHARQLVAVAEAARKIAESDKYEDECEECGSQYDLLADDMTALITTYKELQGGEDDTTRT